ncbi:MAG: helix-turn-helix domain-containing protein [Muribaculaceae bacterium]|nr:helix-turn-helix domain-containing protein [Muribaculaceae bacterium]
MKKQSTPLTDGEMLKRILSIVETHFKSPPRQSKTYVYDNKSLMALLNIKDKYLKKLRDNGYLGYSREGDKYWYTQEDVDRFLSRFHYIPFASNKDLPML